MAWLVLKDGKVFEGEKFGFWPTDDKEIGGEVVFNTSRSEERRVGKECIYRW